MYVISLINEAYTVYIFTLFLYINLNSFIQLIKYYYSVNINRNFISYACKICFQICYIFVSLASSLSSFILYITVSYRDVAYTIVNFSIVYILCVNMFINRSEKNYQRRFYSYKHVKELEEIFRFIQFLAHCLVTIT